MFGNGGKVARQENAETMALLKSVSSPEPGPIVHGNVVKLRLPQMSDYTAWAELRSLSREFLTPWEPSWTLNELTRLSYRRRVRHYVREARDDTGYAFFMFHRADKQLLGGLTISNVRRGVTQSGTLGYWVGEPYTRLGYMSEGIKTVLPFVFDTLRLHRLEAACLPHNAASIKLLGKTGFRQEGLARSYLRINGVWQDHMLYAMIYSDTRP